MLGDVAPNDLILVHAGAAITRLDDNPLRDEQTAKREVSR
jgi:hydrogenase maturation factor